MASAPSESTCQSACRPASGSAPARDAERQERRRGDRAGDCQRRATDRDHEDTRTAHRRALAARRAEREQRRLVELCRRELAVQHDRNRNDTRDAGDDREDQQHIGEHIDRVACAGALDLEALRLEFGILAEDLFDGRGHSRDIGRPDADRVAGGVRDAVVIRPVERRGQQQHATGAAERRKVERTTDDADDVEMGLGPVEPKGTAVAEAGERLRRHRDGVDGVAHAEVRQRRQSLADVDLVERVGVREPAGDEPRTINLGAERTVDRCRDQLVLERRAGRPQEEEVDNTDALHPGCGAQHRELGRRVGPELDLDVR